MTERVTACEVKDVRPTESDVMPMIAAASAVVDQINAKCGKSFTDAQLTMIELWLAAHFVGTIDPVKSKTKFENYEETFQVGSTALKGILSDKYGQTANMISGGCLAEFDQSPASVDFF